jgi:abhydrolase domain-containing protein 6
MGRATRLLLGFVLVVSTCAAVIYIAFPQLIVSAMVSLARRAAAVERHVTEVDGHVIAYLEGGAGEPVVLLHGFGASKDLWNSVAIKLTPHYRVIAPDIPGFGETAVQAGAKYDAESQVTRLHLFLTAIGVRQHHIGGHSMGGTIATVYAVSYPQFVRSLMIGSAPGVRSPVRSELERAIDAGRNPLLPRSEEDFDALMKLIFFRPPSIPSPLKRVMLHDLIERQSVNARLFDEFSQAGESALEPLLSRIQAPTLVVWGTADRLVDPSAAGVYVSSIDGAESATFEACGHALPRECPEALANRYLTFLRTLR